jgi:hypothetical protein
VGGVIGEGCPEKLNRNGQHPIWEHRGITVSTLGFPFGISSRQSIGMNTCDSRLFPEFAKNSAGTGFGSISEPEIMRSALVSLLIFGTREFGKNEAWRGSFVPVSFWQPSPLHVHNLANSNFEKRILKKSKRNHAYDVSRSQPFHRHSASHGREFSQPSDRR